MHATADTAPGQGSVLAWKYSKSREKLPLEAADAMTVSLKGLLGGNGPAVKRITAT